MLETKEVDLTKAQAPVAAVGGQVAISDDLDWIRICTLLALPTASSIAETFGHFPAEMSPVNVFY